MVHCDDIYHYSLCSLYLDISVLTQSQNKHISHWSWLRFLEKGDGLSDTGLDYPYLLRWLICMIFIIFYSSVNSDEGARSSAKPSNLQLFTSCLRGLGRLRHTRTHSERNGRCFNSTYRIHASVSRADAVSSSLSHYYLTFFESLLLFALFERMVGYQMRWPRFRSFHNCFCVFNANLCFKVKARQASSLPITAQTFCSLAAACALAGSRCSSYRT